MSDLIERLRAQGRDAFAKQYSLGMFKLCDEAAERIEALEAALREVRSYNVDIDAGRINYRPKDHIQVIDAALAPETEK